MIAVDYWPGAVLSMNKDEFGITHLWLYRDEAARHSHEGDDVLHVIFEEGMILFRVFDTAGSVMLLVDEMMSRIRMMREERQAS